MPYAYQIFPIQHLALVVAEGRVSAEEVLTASTRMFEDPAWETVDAQICDFQQVQGVAFTLDDMKALLEMERRFDHKIREGKQALVVARELHESLCKLYAAMSRLRRRPQVIEVFRSMEAALAWVGVSALPGDEDARRSQRAAG